jgi:hypothetical protein
MSRRAVNLAVLSSFLCRLTASGWAGSCLGQRGSNPCTSLHSVTKS